MDGADKATISAVWYGDCRKSPSEIPTDRLTDSLRSCGTTGFTGQRYDDTGLYPDSLRSYGTCGYYGARYYDPEIGRFISPDTIVPDPMNPQAFNRYSYCLNNPLKFTDPSGHTVDFYVKDRNFDLLVEA